MSKDAIFETPVFNLKPKPGNSLVNIVTAAIEYANNTNYDVSFTHMGIEILVDKKSDVGEVVDNFINNLNSKLILEKQLQSPGNDFTFPKINNDTPYLQRYLQQENRLGDYPAPDPIMCRSLDNNHVNI